MENDEYWIDLIRRAALAGRRRIEARDSECEDPLQKEWDAETESARCRSMLDMWMTWWFEISGEAAHVSRAPREEPGW